MITAIIVDDEQHCTDRLSHLLKEYAHNVTLEGMYANVEDAATAIQQIQPQLVFLDVEIHNKTGFDLLKSLPEINFHVIFTTAYEKYAVQAFKFSAVDYLLKPVDADDLKLALEKLQTKISKEEISKKFDVLFHNLRNMQGVSKKISVPTVKGFVYLQVNDIIYCRSEVNYTTLFLKDKQKITVAKTLKEFEDLLKDYNFYRVHNSSLINLSYIKSYNKGKGGCVVMSDNSEIEVSTRRKDDFLKRLAEIF
ncbi:LytR/AlgR family response regulator transcription factor [Foetidibacter luteolus]|uniref:LytR/AlgR family response regulator transcription factor n=1 Tax=Foetidibacter luteolus TaxID=2608880 RepID=UPI00129B4832|nr:LytTR family DNA-binding domain-containing protein [Foetidibacter luteolus]